MQCLTAVCDGALGSNGTLGYRPTARGSILLAPLRITEAKPLKLVQPGVKWGSLVDMAETERSVRQSVRVPIGIARRVRALAKRRKTRANPALVDRIESGIQRKVAEKE